MHVPSKGIQLAEAGEWETLEMLLDIEANHAKERDHFGMLPLHWACTEKNVPHSLLKLLLEKNPQAARTKNNSHMLPIHIAIRSQLPFQHIELLVASYPSATLEINGDGKTPIELARESISCNQKENDTMKLLVDTRKTIVEGPDEDGDDNDDDNNKLERSKSGFIRAGSISSLEDSLPELIGHLSELNVSMKKSGRIYEMVKAYTSNYGTLSNNSTRLSQSSSTCSETAAHISSEESAPNSSFNNDDAGILSKFSKNNEQACSEDYELVWIKGAFGISLGRIMDRTVEQKGAIIVKLTNETGITAGINKARLGDILVGIESEDVSQHCFDDIGDILASKSRPITLTFRTCQRKSDVYDENYHSTSANSMTTSRTSNTSSCNDRFSDYNSINSIFSDEMEKWCEEQDAIHSQMLVLLTETLSRCETLLQDLQDKGQENFNDTLCNIID